MGGVISVQDAEVKEAMQKRAVKGGDGGSTQAEYLLPDGKGAQRVAYETTFVKRET